MPASSTAPAAPRDPQWILRLNHRNRTLVSIGLLLALGWHLWDLSAPAWAFGLLAVHLLVYPHLLFAWSLRRPDPVAAERRNMALDAVLLGLWVGALGMPFEITFALMATVSLHPMLFEGPRGFIRAFSLLWGGVLTGWGFSGFASSNALSPTVSSLILACLWGYLVVLTYGGYQRGAASKRLSQALNASAEALQQRLNEIGGLQEQVRLRQARELQQSKEARVLETAVAERTRELQGAADEAEGRERDQRQLMALVAHEVSSPMGTVISAARLIELHDKEGRHKTELFRIQRSVARLKTFLDNFLSTERLDAGLAALGSQRVWLDAVIRKAVRQVQEADPAFRCNLQAPAHLCCVLGDERLLEVLVFNLLDNARKYAGTAHPVEVSVGRNAEGATVLSVRDHGPGIHADDLPHVTARFFRSERVQGVPGTGVGLNLVDRIARLHEGRLQIDSQVGQGSCFSLVLPPERGETVEPDDLPEWADSVSAEEHAERLHLGDATGAAAAPAAPGGTRHA